MVMHNPAIHLRSIRYQPPEKQPEIYPYAVPAIRSLAQLEFETPITFFVGENGSGKSTLIETLAMAVGSINAGASRLNEDGTLTAVSELADYFKLVWNRRTRKGFFLRAEDFFGYVRTLEASRAESVEELKRVDEEYKGRSRIAKAGASMPHARALNDLRQRYGDGLDTRSHGEGYLAFFQNRFIPNGLYILDEPEAPLSPMHQITFVSMLKKMVAQNAQFIIATHSPIILACPDSQILSFDHQPITPVVWKELDHVKITRDFLNNPDQFLRHL